MTTTALRTDLEVRIAEWRGMTVPCSNRGVAFQGEPDEQVLCNHSEHGYTSRIPDPKAAAIVEVLTEECTKCEGRGYYHRDGIGLFPQFDHYFNCPFCGGDRVELHQDEMGPVSDGGHGTGRVSRPFHEYGDGAFSGVIGRLAIEQLKVCSASERETWETIARTAIFFHDGFTLTTVDAALKESDNA